jgi:hypothetical protein
MDQKGGLYFQAGREVKARREDRPPGKEEGKKVLSSISTSFPRRWKSRPAQRITGVVSPPSFRQQTKSSLTISHSFPAEPPLFAIRSTTSAFPFYNIPRRPPFQSLMKKSIPIKSKADFVCDFSGPRGVYSTHSPVSRTAQVCDSV